MTQRPLYFLPPEASPVAVQKPGRQLLSCRVSSPDTMAQGSFQDLAAPHAAGESKCQVLPGGKGKGRREPAKLCRPRRKKLLQLKRGTWWYILLLPQLSNSDRTQSKSQDMFSLWLCTFIVYLLPPGACEKRSWSSTSLCRQFQQHRSKGERNEATGDMETSAHDPTHVQPQIFYAI